MGTDSQNLDGKVCTADAGGQVEEGVGPWILTASAHLFNVLKVTRRDPTEV